MRLRTLVRAAPLVAALSLFTFVAGATERDAPPPNPEPEAELGMLKRVVAEAMMGTGVATLGYLAGPKLFGASCRSCRDAASFAGGAALFPLGAYWGGYITGGRGRILHMVFPSLVLSGISVIALTRAEDDGSTRDPPLHSVKWAALASAPLSIALYELSHRWVVSKERAHPTLAELRLSAQPLPGGLALRGTVGF